MDQHHLIDDEDENIDLMLMDEDRSCVARCRSTIRQIFIPSSIRLALKAQQKLFKAFVVTPVEHKRFRLSTGDFLNYVDIHGSGHEYCSDLDQSTSKSNRIGRDDKFINDRKPMLLLMHGYGSGLAMFFDNYDKFAQQFSRVIAVDWRGMGASSRGYRTPHPCTFCFCGPWCFCGKSNTFYDEIPAVNYFIDSLHELVESLKLSNIVIAGHSLGGYLSARYLMKYHRLVEERNLGCCQIVGLIMFSPVGLEPVPEPERIVPPRAVSFKAAAVVGLLQSNYTPQGLIRAFGCFGRQRVHMLVARRFGSDRWTTTESEVISDYLYHISALPRAGEDALNALLQLVFTLVPSTEGQNHTRPKCLARKPLTPKDLSVLAPFDEKNHPLTTSPHLCSRDITDIKESDAKYNNLGNEGDDTGQNSHLKSGIPFLLMYGDYDWLHFPQAGKFINELQSDYGVNASFELIRNAGHHLYMDNAGHFHSVIEKWLHSNFRCSNI